MALAACAPSSGWTRADRVCSGGDPARVCFDAEPDAPVVLEVGDVELVPGECAFSSRLRGGRTRVRLRDGRGDAPKTRGVGMRRGGTTTVRLTSEGKLRVERASCED